MEAYQNEGDTTEHDPFDDEDVIEGQGTIALEVLEECLMRMYCSFLLVVAVLFLVSQLRQN